MNPISIAKPPPPPYTAIWNELLPRWASCSTVLHFSQVFAGVFQYPITHDWHIGPRYPVLQTALDAQPSLNPVFKLAELLAFRASSKEKFPLTAAVVLASSARLRRYCRQDGKNGKDDIDGMDGNALPYLSKNENATGKPISSTSSAFRSLRRSEPPCSAAAACSSARSAVSIARHFRHSGSLDPISQTRGGLFCCRQTRSEPGQDISPSGAAVETHARGAFVDLRRSGVVHFDALAKPRVQELAGETVCLIPKAVRRLCMNGVSFCHKLVLAVVTGTSVAVPRCMPRNAMALPRERDQLLEIPCRGIFILILPGKSA